MNLTHLHLMLNHVPVRGTAFGIWRKSNELKKAALGVLGIAALIAIPAYFTGEPAEEVVESLPGVSGTIIEQHEQAAVIAFTGIVALGAVALAGLFLLRRGKVVHPSFGSMMLVLSLLVSALMEWTANIGGQIRHTEIRPGASPAASSKENYHE